MCLLKLLFASSLLALAPAVLAADRPRNCESPEAGADLIACAAARHRAADASLNRVYRQLVSVLKQRREPELEQRLRVSQRDWLRFRQSHCEFEATYEGAGGSYVSAKLDECLTETSVGRTTYLEGLLTQLHAGSN